MAIRLRPTYIVMPDDLNANESCVGAWVYDDSHIVSITLNLSTGGAKAWLYRWTGPRRAFTLVDTAILNGGAATPITQVHSSPSGNRGVVVFYDSSDGGKKKFLGLTVSSGSISGGAAFSVDVDDLIHPSANASSIFSPIKVKDNGTWQALMDTDAGIIDGTNTPPTIYVFSGDMSSVTSMPSAMVDLPSFGYGTTEEALWGNHQLHVLQGDRLDNDNLAALIQASVVGGDALEQKWYAFIEVNNDGSFVTREVDTFSGLPTSGYIHITARGGLYWNISSDVPNRVQYPNGIRDSDLSPGEEQFGASNQYGQYVYSLVMIDPVGSGISYHADIYSRYIQSNAQVGQEYILAFTIEDLGEVGTDPNAIFVTSSTFTFWFADKQALIAIATDGQPMIASPGRAPWLRHRQRDDQRVAYTRAGNPPTSRQGSIRMGQANTYW